MLQGTSIRTRLGATAKRQVIYPQRSVLPKHPKHLVTLSNRVATDGIRSLGDAPLPAMRQLYGNISRQLQLCYLRRVWVRYYTKQKQEGSGRLDMSSGLLSVISKQRGSGRKGKQRHITAYLPNAVSPWPTYLHASSPTSFRHRPLRICRFRAFMALRAG